MMPKEQPPASLSEESIRYDARFDLEIAPDWQGNGIPFLSSHSRPDENSDPIRTLTSRFVDTTYEVLNQFELPEGCRFERVSGDARDICSGFGNSRPDKAKPHYSYYHYHFFFYAPEKAIAEEVFQRIQDRLKMFLADVFADEGIQITTTVEEK